MDERDFDEQRSELKRKMLMSIRPALEAARRWRDEALVEFPRYRQHRVERPE